MSDTARSPWAFNRRNKPRWPKPEDSTGDYIGLMKGKDQYWKATGPARETFKRLALEIKPELEKCADAVPGSSWVTWSIYMVGPTPQTTVPTVIFICDELKPRKDAWKLIQKGDILQRYPGMKSGHMSSAPEIK
jgi:peptide-N4-(N-acetyl-beta-glucosaminyl)asparagine amidase